MMVEFSNVFPAAYSVEVLTEFPVAELEQYEFVRSGEFPRGDLLLEVATNAGAYWLASIRQPGGSISGALTSVHSTPSPTVLLAVVGGDALTIDVNEPSEYQWLDTAGPVVAVRAVVAERLLLLATPWSVTALGRDGVRWRTDRLAIDGLRLDEVEGGMLAGVADPGDEEPRDFAVDLRTGKHWGGTPPAWSSWS